MPGRFGNLETDEKGKIINFQEKPEGDGLWINGGFFVLNSGIFKYLEMGFGSAWMPCEIKLN